jgi:hypothetical protein
VALVDTGDDLDAVLIASLQVVRRCELLDIQNCVLLSVLVP